MHHPTDRMPYTTVFVTPGTEHWLEREIVNGSTIKNRSDDTLLSIRRQMYGNRCVTYRDIRTLAHARTHAAEHTCDTQIHAVPTYVNIA